MSPLFKHRLLLKVGVSLLGVTISQHHVLFNYYLIFNITIQIISIMSY